jgi:AraC-like DNA-binding protein
MINVRSRLLTYVLIAIYGMIASPPVFAKAQELTVEQLLNNLRTGQFTGKKIDLELKQADMETLIEYLEPAAGFSFDLSPDLVQIQQDKNDFFFQQAPWDQILSIALRELRLEALPKDGGIYIQPLSEKLIRVVQENQTPEPQNRTLVFILALIILVGSAAGLYLFKRKYKQKAKSSKKLSLDPVLADEIAKKVTYLCELEKIYRDPGLSVHSLSERLDIPAYQLSWILNERMNQTFSVLVNTYRTNEVKKRLASTEDSDETILNIALEAGFNTKTSFNRVFKKFTGMTPSQFRESRTGEKDI